MTALLKARPLWSAFEAAAATGGQLLTANEDGRQGSDDWTVQGLSFDTRSLQKGDLFVAIKGVRDGHEFLAQAAEKGAAAALVSTVPTDAPEGFPLLKVPDVMAGLEALAVAARDRNFGKSIAVTGSVGKTTTKEMLRTALGGNEHVHAAEKSFNNHLGVPMSLASFPDRAAFGVFEIGMNHLGEITPLTGFVKPHVAIITAIAPAHLGNFNSVDEIAQAKAEILSGVRVGGTAVLPADSEYYEFLCAEAKRFGIKRIVPFGSQEAAKDGVYLRDYTSDGVTGDVSATVYGKEVQFTLSSPGRHLAMNAMAVLAACCEVGLNVSDATRNLSQFSAGEGRGAQQTLSINGGQVTVLDEAYNANTASMGAAFAVLGAKTPKGEGRRIAVLGEMKELGEYSRDLHASLASPIIENDIDRIWLAGAEMKALKEALPPAKVAGWSENAAELEASLAQDLQDGDVVLFKGSNASGIGALLLRLLAKTDTAR